MSREGRARFPSDRAFSRAAPWPLWGRVHGVGAAARPRIDLVYFLLYWDIKVQFDY